MLSLSLTPGAIVQLLGIIPAFRTVNRFYPPRCGFGGWFSIRFKGRMHSSVTINKKKEDIQQEVQHMIDEYSRCSRIARIRRQAETQKVDFDIAVEAGSLKEVAVEYAKSYGATHVILPRDLKKNKKYFMDSLSCAIYRMKTDSSVETVRGFEAAEVSGLSLGTHFNTETYEQEEEIFENSVCSVCMNRRPRIGGQTRDFTYAELHLATNGFSEKKLLPIRGKRTYRGQLNDLQLITIREHPLKTIKENDFKTEVQILGNFRHENVAVLLGSFAKGTHRLLIYEFVCNGSLNKHLSDKRREFTWERRIKIAHGAAKGLEYLHGKQSYGSVRPSNILITHDYHPLLSYFGLARSQYEDIDLSSETRVLKTFEYLPPEYEGTGIDLSKADVYSFGVVLLELITGRKTIEDTDGQSFLRWARPSLRKKKYMELIDPVVQDSVDLYQLYWMVRVTDKCLSWDPNSRPSINKLVKDLECIVNHCGAEDFSPTESELMAATVSDQFQGWSKSTFSQYQTYSKPYALDY
ncbi:serine threonine- kinase CDG1-like [Olea europaea subsp. europaea]|uniref:Serine threonine- kinase CDG1-like n=1 Tax=Olea europaea subsp. europaea TaxID=158383 RepID=A0A8S0TQ27_OLEEU|nr:serine threonine- kinase CDG1-like [Olea europaea subsp. europaea]